MIRKILVASVAVAALSIAACQQKDEAPAADAAASADSAAASADTAAAAAEAPAKE